MCISPRLIRFLAKMVIIFLAAIVAIAYLGEAIPFGEAVVILLFMAISTCMMEKE